MTRENDKPMKSLGGQQARQVLLDNHAPQRLLRHGEMITEVVQTLCRHLLAVGIRLESELAETGAMLHDAGKLVVPEELDGPGVRHCEEGAKLLRQAGWPEKVTSFCLSHENWGASASLEELLVALADNLWKGKRVAELEERIIREVAGLSGRELWPLYTELDDLFEFIAGEGDKRLANSGIVEKG